MEAQAIAAFWLGAVLISAWSNVPVPAAISATPSQVSTSRDECVLTGQVLDAVSVPLDRATVRLVGSDLPGPRIAVTDSAGRFAFAGLAAGSFALSAVKAGYVASYYGSVRPGRGPAVPIALAPGRPVAVSITLFRAAAVSGTITGEFGQAMVQVQVRVRPVSAYGEALVSTGTTDERGAFRVVGLAPGEYLVVATPLPLPGDATLVTDEQVKWALQEVSNSRGNGLASPRSFSRHEGLPVTYVPMFFPGTATFEDAARISLSAGEQRDVSFSMRLVPTATISGTVVMPSGTPAALFLLPKPSTSQSASEFAGEPSVTREVSVSKDGRFSVSGIPPGAKILLARWDLDASGYVRSPSTATRWAERELAVDGRDMSDLVMTLHPGVVVSGTVHLENKGSAIRPDFDSARVTLVAVNPGPPALVGNFVATIGRDGTFSFPSVMSGSYYVKVTPTPLRGPNGTRWTVKSAVTQGLDISDSSLNVGHNDNSFLSSLDVAITLTDRQSELSGVLLDADNRPTSAFSVVVLSAASEFWTRGSRRVRAAQPATDGTYRIEDLPGGTYYVVAVADLDPEALADREFLERLQQSALRFTLSDGERRSLDLKVGGGIAR